MVKELKCKFPAERKQLLKMFKIDQEIRINGDYSDPNTLLKMAKNDLAHQQELVKILKIIKVPTIENIGYDGAEAVWIIGQHAGYDLKLMKRVLKLILKSTENNPEAGYYRGIPYLIDRINIFEGKKQIYGTQFWSSPTGIPEPYPIEDAKSIDQLRKKFGLRSFSSYKKEIIKDNKSKVRDQYLIVARF